MILLLSPAKTWKSFGNLEIEINTPYYISDCSIDGFTKTENGYTAKYEGLPDGELTFNLSTSENPQKSIPPYNYIGWVIIGAIGAIMVISIGAFCVLVIRKRKKRRGSV